MENLDRRSFATSFDNSIAIIHIKEGVYDLVTDINESNILIDYIKATEGMPEVKALLVINEEGHYGEDDYDNFITGILGPQESGDDQGPPKFAQKDVRFREINILNKIIKVFSEYRKLCFSGIVGDIVTPFIGTSLSMDIRYATEGTRFVMVHNKYGLHPSGALPFFLSQNVHHSRALDLQFKTGFSVEEAYQLGLVNKIFPSENFTKRCLHEIGHFIRCENSTISITKRLTNYTRKALSDYFLYESSLLNL
ncbi:MAG: enoyl-CoA hydratase/isomerase family protein [Bacteroidota bacterium]